MTGSLRRAGFVARSTTVWFLRAVLLIALASIAMPVAAASRPTAQPAPTAVVTFFERDPVGDARWDVDGAALLRTRWNADAAAFAFDRPGSLSAHYRSDLDAARLALPIAPAVTQADAFAAAAVFVIEPDGFSADPNGYFQIAWGLWNSATTGRERTGTPDRFATDTFDCAEWDWFPNVSPWFGGPYLGPVLFGAEDRDNPLFEFLGSFANASFASSEATLPLGVPLLATLEHRPPDRVLTARVFQIGEDDVLTPVEGAIAEIPVAGLSKPAFVFDRIGLLLWHDGFGVPGAPALDAWVTFHTLAFRRGALVAPEQLWRAAASSR